MAVILFCIPAAPVAEDYASARERMVQRDIAARGVEDSRVIKAMRKVRRHLFVPFMLRWQAYSDHPLPIGEGQTISQPYVVALMTEALELEGKERVLEIGTGSGYQAAVLAEIVDEVYSIEIRPGLARTGTKVLAENGYANVRVKTGDGYFGWPEKAPFDAVIVTAAANHIPAPLLRQLKEGGRLIIPLGRTTYTQYLTLVTKKKDKLEVDQLGPVAFVPMVGEVEKPREIPKAPK
jgi:protein-L-isoaspartate(D-aspartate) O-methyltransferase